MNKNTSYIENPSFAIKASDLSDVVLKNIEDVNNKKMEQEKVIEDYIYFVSKLNVEQTKEICLHIINGEYNIAEEILRKRRKLVYNNKVSGRFHPLKKTLDMSEDEMISYYTNKDNGIFYTKNLIIVPNKIIINLIRKYFIDKKRLNLLKQGRPLVRKQLM